jgi:uncharacterized membrane protein
MHTHPNPARAPEPAPEGPAPQPRVLPAGEGAAWWGESWRIFCAAPLPWMGILLVFVVMSIVLSFVPIIGHAIYVVITPAFAGGVMLGCDALARGAPLTVGHLFEGFRGPRLAPLLMLGLLSLAIMFAVAVFTAATIFLALGASGLGEILRILNSADVATIDYGSLAQAVVTAGPAILLVLLVAVAVALLVAMAYWFAPALVVLNGEPPFAALAKSFAASSRNIGAFLLYGLIYIGLAFAATIPLGLGWLVLGPMLAGSCYAGWRTIFGR